MLQTNLLSYRLHEIAPRLSAASGKREFALDLKGGSAFRLTSLRGTRWLAAAILTPPSSATWRSQVVTGRASCRGLARLDSGFPCLMRRCGGVSHPQATDVQRRCPGGRNNSFTLPSASGGAPCSQVGIAFFSGGYSDSIGSHTSSTLSVKRSPISRSVTLPRRCG